MSAEASRRAGEEPFDPLSESFTRRELVEVVIDAARLRRQYRRRPTLIAMLDEAGFV